MKKLLSILLLFISFASVGQVFPVKQNMGNTTTQVHAPGALIADSVFALQKSFPDTATANASAADNIDGSLIRVGTILYMRVGSAWVQQGSSAPTIFYFQKTLSQVASLVSAGTLVKGAMYKITGADVTLYNDGTNPGTTIFLVAIDSNRLSPTGVGMFWNPVYTTSGANYGIWTPYSTASAAITAGVFKPGETITANNGAVGVLVGGFSINNIYFTATSGTWSAATSITGGTSGATATISSVVQKAYTTGTKVFWGGYAWSNNAGNIGVASNNIILNSEWSKVAYNSTDYVVAYDAITYDYANNLIIRRTDANNNTVQYSSSDKTYFNVTKGLAGTPISVFQWGKPLMTGNIVNSGYLDCVNTLGSYVNNQLYRLSISTNNFLTANSLFEGNNLYFKSEMSNNLLLDVCDFWSNNLHDGSQMNGNICFNNAYFHDNWLDHSSTMNSNQVRQAEFYENQERYISNINSNISIQKWGYITKNNMLASTINSNTLNGLYTTAVGSDQAYINNNVMNYGRIDANTLTVTFNGRRVYICNNFFQGDNNQDRPIRYSIVSGCTVSGSGNTYIRSNRLYIGQLLNLTVTNANDITDCTIDDVVLDYGGGTTDATGGLRAAIFKADYISVSFSKTFAGTTGLGAIGSVTIPPIIIPTGYFISDIGYDVTGGLTGTGAIINLGIATDGPTAALNNAYGDLASLNSAPMLLNLIMSLNKATANRLVIMTVSSAAITAGTMGLVIHAVKLK